MRNIKGIINRRRSLFNLFQVFGEAPPFPVLVMAHLTLACQCACDMCYQRDADFRFQTPEWMPLSRFDELLRQSRRFLLRPLIHLYGGEPLIHPEFAEVLRRLDQRGFEATLNTNGELLERHAPQLAGSRVRMVNVSLDGLGADHDALRGRRGLFDKALRGIRSLRALDDKIHVNINYVVNPKNATRLYEDMIGFEGLLRGTRIDYLSIEHLAFTRGMATYAQGVDVTRLHGELSRIRARDFPFPVSATPVVKLADLERYYGSMEPLDRVNCNVPWIALNVMPGGEVTPGGAMFACAEVVGDLGSEDLREIWNGASMRGFRRRIRTSMPEDCMRCCHTLHYSPLITCRPADPSGSGR